VLRFELDEDVHKQRHFWRQEKEGREEASGLLIVGLPLLASKLQVRESFLILGIGLGPAANSNPVCRDHEGIRLELLIGMDKWRLFCKICHLFLISCDLCEAEEHRQHSVPQLWPSLHL
jgi:hypothetical protein